MKTSPVSESSIQKNPVCHISFNFLLPPQKKNKYAFSPPPPPKKNLLSHPSPKKNWFWTNWNLIFPTKNRLSPTPSQKKNAMKKENPLPFSVTKKAAPRNNPTTRPRSNASPLEIYTGPAPMPFVSGSSKPEAMAMYFLLNMGIFQPATC